jgi:hypothetical protein
LDLIPVTKSEGAPLQYAFDTARSARLRGAHGDEIVRDVLIDEEVSLIPPSVCVHPR